MSSKSINTDEYLVGELGNNNESAFTEIYNRYWKPLYNTAYSIIQVQDSAQDAVQTVFISLWRRRNEAVINSLGAYLHQATRFQVLKAIRAEKADKDFQHRLINVSKQILTEDPMLFKELQELFRAVIKTLTPDEQEFFLLNREQGLTYKEIAAEKNISVKTVEKKMSSALKKIRNKFDDPMMVLLFFHFMR